MAAAGRCPRGVEPERRSVAVLRRGIATAGRGCERLVRSRGTPSQDRAQCGRRLRLRSRGGALTKVPETPHGPTRGVARPRPVGRGRPRDVEGDRPRAEPLRRTLCEGACVPPDEPEGRGRGRPRCLLDRGTDILRRPGDETATPPRCRTLARARRDVRRDPRDPAASRAGLEGQGPRVARPREGGGGLRDLRPPPGRLAGRPGRPSRPAGRTRPFEEPEGPPPGVRYDPAKGPNGPIDMDRERSRPRSARTAGRGPDRNRYSPHTRSPRRRSLRS